MEDKTLTKKEVQDLLDGQTAVILDAVDEKLEGKADKESANKILSSQDEIITKLDVLLQEKTIGDEQDKRQKKVLQIHNNALKSKEILSPQETTEIDNLRVF